MNFKFQTNLISAAVLGVLLAGCGGGGSSGTTPVQAPVVSSAPLSQAASVGAAVNFSVQATGSAPLSYQWQRDGVDIAGATSATYTLLNASLDDSNAHFRVQLKNAAGSIVSSDATLKVSGIALYAGSLTESGNVDGNLTSARFAGTTGLSFDAQGNLLVADRYNGAIRKIGKDGKVTTFVGKDQGLSEPIGIALDGAGNLYVSDTNIKKVTPTGAVSLAVTIPFGHARALGAYYPSGVAVDASGNIYAANGLGLRKVTPTGTVSILNGVDVADSLFGVPEVQFWGMTSDRNKNVYFIGDGGIFKTAADGSSKLIINKGARAMAVDASDTLYRVGDGTISKFAVNGSDVIVAGVEGQTTVAQTGVLPGRLGQVNGIAVDDKGFIYFSSGSAVLKIGLP
ncbi:MAG: hypothetical protein RL748_2745 [Pseudomonadota bacterium]